METKQLELTRCELKFAENVGEFSGYGSVFGVVDAQKDIVKPGAFDKVLKSGDPVKVYVNHGWKRGELPVGIWTDLEQDSIGLKGNAKLETRMPAALDAYWSIKSGMVNGLSIGFAVDPSAIEIRNGGGRIIHSVAYLKEISIVDVPANDQALISGVKEGYEDYVITELSNVQTVRELERFLRDVGGFTRSAAMVVISRARDILLSGDQIKSGDASAVLDRINQISNKLR